MRLPLPGHRKATGYTHSERKLFAYKDIGGQRGCRDDSPWHSIASEAPQTPIMNAFEASWRLCVSQAYPMPRLDTINLLLNWPTQ